MKYGILKYFIVILKSPPFFNMTASFKISNGNPYFLWVWILQTITRHFLGLGVEGA